MFSDFQIRKSVGRSVSLAFHKPSAKYYALKRISADNYTDVEFKSICAEIQNLQLFSHQNIIKICSVTVKNFDINCIYPFYCFGSAKEAMKNWFFTGFPEGKQLTNSQNKQRNLMNFPPSVISALILKDILTALDYLHKRGIIHR
jgi:serine/threonine protein kinase